MKRSLLIVLFCLCLTACGFHFRSKAWLPAKIQTLNIQSENKQISDALKGAFSSMGIRITTHSPYTLLISNYTLSQSQATALIAGMPSTASYSLRLTASLLFNHKEIASNSFSSSQSITLNSNALHVSKPTASLITQFYNDIIENLYLWLTTSNVKKQVVKAGHAN